jgi:hypothetical protein
MKYIHINNPNSFLYRDSVLKGDILFTENVQKSAYVNFSNAHVAEGAVF